MFFSSFFITAAILALLPGRSSSCSENEIEAECVNPCNTCEQKGSCDTPPACQPGCDCKPGFLRDESGLCVPEQRCTAKVESPKCPKNAVYLPCAQLPLPTCENPDAEPDYEDECVAGCVCRTGFLKRKDGRCVTPDRCHPRKDHRKETPGTCQEGEEYYECTPSCKNTCENFNNPRVKCRCGPPGCFCREGLVRRSDGKCVLPKQCPRSPSPNDPSPKCPKNAIFIECGSPCPPTCDDLQPAPCQEKCTTACYCKPGYLKRKDGVCVRPTDCNPPKKKERVAPKCPENAIFIECGSPCPPTCDDRLPVCEEKCIKACFCKPGFLLKLDEAKCVKPENCNTSPPSNSTATPDAMRCPANEEPSDCVVPCNDCKIRGNCKFFACIKGCDCKKGHFRNADGKCILASECPETMTPPPECKADEQFYECTPSCRNTCENFANAKARCYCGPPGCFCREGLVKRADGKCVPPNQCHVTPPPECKADEQFYECTPSCRNTCENFANAKARCYCGPPGCFCREGLVKRADGKCVPPNQCHAPPPAECGEDQKFYNCTPICKNTCENFSHPAFRCGCGPPGCFCRDGLVKRADGKCVPPNQCRTTKPASCPENAEFSACGPRCRPTCKDPFPLPCSEPCVEGCFCKSGFVEDTEGRCVRLRHCTKKCVLPGEEFQECGSTCPDTCENKGHPPPGTCPYRCNRGCFCKRGLYRSKSGQCVPLKDCGREHNFVTTSKPIIKRESTDMLTVTVPDDCHGCPNRVECETYCKSLGDFVGLCAGKDSLHCRCA